MLVCPPVFKTGEGGEELPGWVRFPHIPAKNPFWLSNQKGFALHDKQTLGQRIQMIIDFA